MNQYGHKIKTYIYISYIIYIYTFIMKQDGHKIKTCIYIYISYIHIEYKLKPRDSDGFER